MSSWYPIFPRTYSSSSLSVTGVVVLRNDGDTVDFLGLEITKASRSFEFRISTELEDSLLSLYGLENSKPTAHLGRRATVRELASAISLQSHEYSNFRTALLKTHLHGTMESRHAIRHATATHTSP